MINLNANRIGAARKAGGGPAPSWDPSQLSGLIGFWRADQGVTLNSGYVSEWAPISGLASPLLQSDAAKQPNYTATGINNLPSIYHDTNGQGMGMVSGVDKLMDYANTDDFFVLMVETMELSASANSTTRDSFDIVGWNNSPAASTYHDRSKTQVNHAMGLIGVSPTSPTRQYQYTTGNPADLFSPRLAASDPRWWAYGARRGRRFERAKNVPGGSAGTAAELSIAFDTTLVSTGGYTEASNVITIPETGYYTIGATAVFTNVNATGNASLGLKVNGGAYTAYSSNTAVTPTTARGFTVTLQLNAGDTIEVFTVWDGTITTRDYINSSGSIVIRIHGYEYYTMDGGITPAAILPSLSSNTLAPSNATTATYTLRTAIGGGSQPSSTFSYTPIGYISELIVCNEVPDAASFTQLNNYLYNRYGLGSSI